MTIEPERSRSSFFLTLLAVLMAGCLILDALPSLGCEMPASSRGQGTDRRGSGPPLMRHASFFSQPNAREAIEETWSGERRQSDRRPYRVIAAADLLAKIGRKERFVLLDCRPEEEYRAGHLPGAVNVSIDSLSFGRETAVKAEMERIRSATGLAMSFVLVDQEGGEEYMPRTKIEEFVRVLPENRDDEVILYCRRPDCTRSPLAARWAIALGYRKVTRYEGGWEDWKKKGYPVEK